MGGEVGRSGVGDSKNICRRIWITRENEPELIWYIRFNVVIFSECIPEYRYSIGYDCGVSIYYVVVDLF